MGALSLIVTFFNTTIGRYCMGGLIVAAAYFAGDVRGRRIEHSKCVAASEAAKEAAENIDRQAKAQAAAEVTATLSDLQVQKEKADAQIADLQAELSSRPVNAPCLYGVSGKPAGGVRNNRHYPSRPRPAGPAVLPSAPEGH